jgi:hypothetical protein
MRGLIVLALSLFTVTNCFGQSSTQTPPAKSPSIQDNSFLIEEAYNQEDGVVQHISSFIRTRGGSWMYSFTQEWPLFGQTHQLSYTIPVARLRELPNRPMGAGDIAINYRYQLVGNGDSRVAIAPRFSVLLPTGDADNQLGAGGTGLQFDIPVSVVVVPSLISHFNAGATFTPNARNDAGDRARTTGVNLGQSFIWLARPRFNVMLETVWNRVESVVGKRLTESSDSVLISPGIRWAYNFKNGLQIVPGVAFPLGVGPSSGDRGVLLYLSFEHPFTHSK